MARARAYCWTVNNPVESDFINIRALSEEARYTIYGKETGEAGVFHLQGYVLFEEKKSFSTVKSFLSRAHIEAAKGSPQQNIEYCSKGGDVVEFGERPKMGRRNDLHEVYEVVKKTSKMKDVVAIMPNFQAIKCAEQYLKYHEEPRNWKPQVYWYCGGTGVGKTKLAREWLGEFDSDVYTCLESNRFWEGYDGHESVLIDDFRKDFCKFHELLKILDRYPYRVEVKGASRQLRARRIAITCPFLPRLVYATREDVGQLLRRIDKVFIVHDGVLEEKSRDEW